MLQEEEEEEEGNKTNKKSQVHHGSNTRYRRFVHVIIMNYDYLKNCCRDGSTLH
jgi:hypothetical protein